MSTVMRGNVLFSTCINGRYDVLLNVLEYLSIAGKSDIV